MYCNTLDSATSVYRNTLSNQLSHTERKRVPCVFRKQSGTFLVRHWSCAYSICNFVRISYTGLVFWDTTLPYYNRMILSKNGKSFIPISHKKSLMKIVTAPHTKFERDFFECSVVYKPTCQISKTMYCQNSVCRIWKIDFIMVDYMGQAGGITGYFLQCREIVIE